MKTAISLSQPLFEKAERLARKMKKSRSYIYREALSEYVARHSPENITERLNRVIDAIGKDEDEKTFARAAFRRVLRRSEW
jgi:metal-responsive CopG/Arc/MetJ family transcriptional regulator